jgi:hypothetical protein
MKGYFEDCFFLIYLDASGKCKNRKSGKHWQFMQDERKDLVNLEICSK